MRKMKEADHGDIKGQTIEVQELIILKNLWEIYVIDYKDDDTIFCLTLGFEDEMGYSSLEELKPFIVLREKDLSGVLPAPNWSWVEEAS